MNKNDIAFLCTLVDSQTPFLDIVRAIYRANRLMCESARRVLTNLHEDIRSALEIREPLVPENVGLGIWPKADSRYKWNYESCGTGACIWLPNVEALLWLFVDFGDSSRIVAGLEFSTPARRKTWIQQFAERPNFEDATWEWYALAKFNPLVDFANLDGELEALLQAYLNEIRRVRALNAGHQPE